MSIESERELEQLRMVVRIVRLALNAMSAAVEPGVTTAQLDAVCARVLAEHEAVATVRVGEVSATADALARCAESAFRQAMRVARAGYRIYEIGRAVEREVRRNRFSVLREYCGHGVGRTIHEYPTVPNYLDLNYRARLTEGLVVAIEPIIAAGAGRSVLDCDGWTVRTADHSLAAHYEHTVVITRGEPVLVTA